MSSATQLVEGGTAANDARACVARSERGAPILIGGSGPHKSLISHEPDFSKEFRFDYYRCSPRVDLMELLAVLEYELTDAFGPIRRGERPPVRHYAEGTQFLDAADVVVCSVLWGGRNERPNLIASGAAAHTVAAIVRKEWWHNPSRVDSRLDVLASGLFDNLREDTRVFANRWNIQRQTWFTDDPDKGDTIYLGSRTSQVFVRLYQPGLKRAQEDGRVAGDILQEERDAVRIELEFKPQNARAKARAATVSPVECWAVSRWTADLLKEILAMNVTPISVAMRRESNRDRALRFMCEQYRAHLLGLLEEHGGDLDAFAIDLIERTGAIGGPQKPQEAHSGV